MKRLFALAAVASLAALPQAAAAGSGNGIAGAIPAYYDAKIFTINFTELSPVAERVILASNPQFNFIYTSDALLPGGGPFVSVIDAIPADGMNPLWNEVEITFLPGHTPRQLFSDDEVLGAADAGEISLHDTDEVYRCSVIGASIPPGGQGRSAVRAGSGTGTATDTPQGPTRATTTWGALKTLYR